MLTGGRVVLVLVGVIGLALALSGCGQESPISLPRTSTTSVEILKESLRTTPGGCEVDVTFRAPSGGLVTFYYDFFDADGHKIRSLNTGLILVETGQVATVSTEGTTNGPSGVPCSQVARFERV